MGAVQVLFRLIDKRVHQNETKGDIRNGKVFPAHSILPFFATKSFWDASDMLNECYIEHTKTKSANASISCILILHQYIQYSDSILW